MSSGHAYFLLSVSAEQELCKDLINVVIVGNKPGYISGSMIVPSLSLRVVSLWKDDFI